MTVVFILYTVIKKLVHVNFNSDGKFLGFFCFFAIYVFTIIVVCGLLQTLLCVHHICLNRRRENNNNSGSWLIYKQFLICDLVRLWYHLRVVQFRRK